jgi:hypothetical protein
MKHKIPIHDLVIRPISTTDETETLRLPVLRFSDHLLRRFGQVEMIRLQPQSELEKRVRWIADEVWTLVEGEIEFNFHDLRSESPSSDSQGQITLTQPTLVLVPFGVAVHLRTDDQPAALLRIASHEDDELQGDLELIEEALP